MKSFRILVLGLVVQTFLLGDVLAEQTVGPDPIPDNASAEGSLVFDEPVLGSVPFGGNITAAMKTALEQEARARVKFYKTRIQTVQWMLAKANARSKFADAMVKREARLFERGSTSITSYEKAQMTLQHAQNNINLWSNKIDEYKAVQEMAEAKLAQVQALQVQE